VRIDAPERRFLPEAQNTVMPARTSPAELEHIQVAAPGKPVFLLRAAALALGLAALLLPARATAIALVGQPAPALADLVTGVWIFKACLFLHATLVWLGAGVSGSAREAQPLLRFVPGPDRPALAAERSILMGLLAVAAVLRLVALDAGPWFDEIRTLVAYARLPLGQIISTYDSQNQHLLYSVLGHMSVALWGDGVAALRVPAVLFGVASLAALYWFGTLIAARREALLATGLLTFSYHHVWFSQNARGYTALLFWTLLASGLFLQLLSARTMRGWRPIAYAAVMALAVFTHVTAVLVVAAHGLIWLALAWQARAQVKRSSFWMPLAGFVLAGTFALQLYALVLPQFVRTLLKPAGAGVATEWQNPLWFLAETIRGLSQGIPGGLAAIASAAVVGLAGIISYSRQGKAITAIMLLPGLVTAVVMFVTEHNLWPRFFFFCAGFAALIAVRGGFVLARRVAGRHATALATVGTVLLIAGSAYTVPGAWAPKQDFSAAREHIERQRTATDAVVTVDLSAYPYAQYLGTDWQSISSETELQQIEAAHRRTWVVYTFPARLSAVQPAIWERLQQHYTTVAEFPGTVGGGAIIVKVRP
jgi:hypothetical protein